MFRESQILIHEMSFILPNGTPIFNKLDISIPSGRTGLVGRNGIGKSTLLRLISGELQPSSGSIQGAVNFALVSQNLIFSKEKSIIQFLNFDLQIEALNRILAGSQDIHDYELLNDQWDIKQQLQRQLELFELENIPPGRKLNQLSGGELTRLQLIKAFSSTDDFILMDEPSNHLDRANRKKLYGLIETLPLSKHLLLASHDRQLLNLMDNILELTPKGIKCYGGNFDQYCAQKDIELKASEKNLLNAKKELQLAKQSIQTTREKHSQNESKGKKLRASHSQAKIILNAMANKSSQSLSTMSTRHQRMLENAEEDLEAAKDELEVSDSIKIDLPTTKVATSKIILHLEGVSFCYPNTNHSTIKNFNFILKGPERISLEGNNGSGKTTLVKLILGELIPQQGSIFLGTNAISYLDQTLHQLNPKLSLIDNFLLLNHDANEQKAHESLAAFLFKNVQAYKLVKDLSGGEKLRAMLACVLMSSKPPQLLILDEPSNHLDLWNIRAIEGALANYHGAMIVISHDQSFLENIHVTKKASLTSF